MTAIPAFGADSNQIEFNFGRATPSNSLQAGPDDQQLGGSGLAWSIDALHQMGKYFDIGLGGGHYHSSPNQSTLFLPNSTTALSSRSTNILLLGRINFNAGSRGTFYAIGGLGWARNTLALTASPATPWTDTGTMESRVLINTSKDTFCYMGGVGLELPLWGSFLIGGDIRYQGTTSAGYSLTPSGASLVGRTDLRTAVNAILMSLKVGIKY
uniref:Uncharacterized protein n=1 Tax=uncultured bacterium CSLF42 TaxID=1091574 RepID=G4WVZ0_9BACT|nr:hypothetical protein [uncultured bacterium CSLF42]